MIQSEVVGIGTVPDGNTPPLRAVRDRYEAALVSGEPRA
jgi:hypothetical protein